MAGGGDKLRSCTQAETGRRQRTASLPLDVLVDIATRTDPATLVRCAATCADMRCRLKDAPGRLRLRHGDRFMPPLLSGYLTLMFNYDLKLELCLVDPTTPNVSRLRRVNGGREGLPLASRDGLVLVRVDQELRVCDPATGSSQTLPSNPAFPVGDPVYTTDISYVLLVGGDDGDGATAVGRHFQVVIGYLELSQQRRHLQLQTFSSKHAAWGRYKDIKVHNMHGSYLVRGLRRALVIGGTVHWLCLSDTRAYILKLHVKTAHVTVMMLPKSFGLDEWNHHLLVTSSVGGSPIILVSDGEKISAWAQSKKSAEWQKQPHAIMEKDAFSRFLDKVGGSRPPMKPGWLDLVCFGERSGIVLISSGCCSFWLDLRSMEIVRWFSDPRLQYTAKIPYETNLAAWVPTFSSTF